MLKPVEGTKFKISKSPSPSASTQEGMSVMSMSKFILSPVLPVVCKLSVILTKFGSRVPVFFHTCIPMNSSVSARQNAEVMEAKYAQ
jgi:hypothetical protein